MNIDIAYLIILIASNVATYFITKSIIIEHTINFLEEEGHITFDDSEK
tara:strand:- start:12 stop:155 length:144 start_codon:yes stop_codon:yes gene_type:complete